MQFNIEMEINRQYCESSCKNDGRWLLLFLRIVFWNMVVLTGIDVLLQCKLHYMDLAITVRNLVFILFIKLLECNIIKIIAKLEYFILRKRNHCGKVVLRFSDDSFQMYYLSTDETRSYSVSDIRVRKIRDFYKIIIKGRFLDINSNDLSEQEEASLQGWMEMVSMGKR